jgi:ankyrin repeat protein
MYVVNEKGATPVFVAAEEGHHEVMRLLADKGADLDLGDVNGCTPLYMAAARGHYEVVRLLAEKGVKLDTRDKLGRTALYMAASKGDYYTVRLLVKKGANTDLAGPCMKKTFRYGPQSKPTMEPNHERQCTPLEVATAMGDFKRDSLLQEAMHPYMIESYLEGYQGVIEILTEHEKRRNEKRRIARLGRLVGSVTRQNPRGVKVPQDMNQEIMKFL